MNMHSDSNERAFWSKWTCILIQMNIHSNEHGFWSCFLVQKELYLHHPVCQEAMNWVVASRGGAWRYKIMILSLRFSVLIGCYGPARPRWSNVSMIYIFFWLKAGQQLILVGWNVCLCDRTSCSGWGDIYPWYLNRWKVSWNDGNWL
jgi:hypothetical protein